MRFALTRLLAAAVVVLACAPLAHAGAAAGGDVSISQIPFSDWLAAQFTNTTFTIFEGRVSSKPFSPLSNLGLVDYGNVQAASNHLSFGFSATGTVKLTTYADGTGQVRVDENFTNALSWADNLSNQVIFGYTPGELIAHPTDVPALSTGHMQIVYTVPDASHPELNVSNVLFFGGGTLTQLKFTSSCTGALRAAFGVPEGTPGMLKEENVGLLNTGGGGATADGFPVEHVDVFALGQPNAGVVGTGGVTEGSPTPRATSRPAVGTWGAIKAMYR